MKILGCLILVGTLSACGVETAATAGAAAEIKRREMEAAKNNLEAARKKIEANTQQQLERAGQARGEEK